VVAILDIVLRRMCEGLLLYVRSKSASQDEEMMRVVGQSVFSVVDVRSFFIQQNVSNA
jgi:hypothetical protein